ncbi:MAG: hypothetical protein PHI70_06350 [Proteiniphilum sp.]|nr:hypothetical protein [Proteiniphilum sp.]MDD3909753.1 hypothetical protein [Proteiniphilum sp.]MDD4416387.1 hypothetical protein [Proteiniphilum sp.]
MMKRVVLAIMLIIMALSSCVDEAPRHSIPFAPVNFRIDLNSYDIALKNAMSYKIFSEKDRRFASDRFGFSGILAVTDATGASIYAYDLCCPYEDNKTIRVEPGYDPTGYNGKACCPSCGSIFVLMYGLGSVESGPAKEPLQRYTVMPLQGDSYRIVN